MERESGRMRARAERKVTPRAVNVGLAEAPAVGLTPAEADPVDDAIEGLHAALSRARDRYEGDPYANPIALMALELVQRMDRDGFDGQATEALIQRLTREAFAGRAAALRAYVGELDPERN